MTSEKQHYINYIQRNKIFLKREYIKNLSVLELQKFFEENHNFSKDLEFGKFCKKKYNVWTEIYCFESWFQNHR